MEEVRKVIDEKSKIEALRTNLKSVIYGKEKIIDLILASFFAGGHVLIEDAPGMGKTTLGQALARSISGKFKRIQFTSDMLPQDLIGYNVYSPESGSLLFRHGPLFANVVLADEINRTNPKTQAALLEAMSEKCVTVDNNTHKLPNPFFVIATQNPYEFHGTFPLPESQLDRFNMKVPIGYPDFDSEIRIVANKAVNDPLNDTAPLLTSEHILQIMESVSKVNCNDSLDGYIVSIVRASRTHKMLRLGASPRSAISLKKTAMALAFIEGRHHVIPDDVKFLAPYLLSHRMFLAEETNGSENSRVLWSIVLEILESINVPQ